MDITSLNQIYTPFLEIILSYFDSVIVRHEPFIIVTLYQLSSETYPSTFELSLSEDAFTTMRFMDVVTAKIKIKISPEKLYLKTALNVWFACLTLCLFFDAIFGRL